MIVKKDNYQKQKTTVFLFFSIRAYKVYQNTQQLVTFLKFQTDLKSDKNYGHSDHSKVFFTPGGIWAC